ncbi:hypothetical protein [Sphingomonas sp. KR3-1]|uniref:hypothetical protein n=1 Tax=Sphingomonas sp. KR3-1 TaxID=3156611 RepID=UPI0032B51B34
MRRFSALDLIEIAEHGAALGPAARALLLLVSGAGLPYDAAASLPLGMRDRWLFALRAMQFGARIEVAHRCSDCGEGFEFALAATDIDRAALPAADAPASLDIDGVAVRAVTAGDLAACEGLGPLARTALRERIAPDGAALDAAALDAALDTLDPDAEVAIAARCPECGADQSILLDIASFFWREIEFRVPRLLQQVADLARINHWSERDILLLPPARRRFYLAAAGQ